jgi:hypothetical protein
MAAAEATATSSSTYLPPALPASRQDIQAAVAKAAELRALHAALLQGGANAGASFASASRSPSVIRLPPAASPALSRAGVAAPSAAEDYPVFAPVNQIRLLATLCSCAATYCGMGKVVPLELDLHFLPCYSFPRNIFQLLGATFVLDSIVLLVRTENVPSGYNY